MITQYFSCNLITDVVINASLATEGNMHTLNYIPGSNFWGIVAGQYYNELVNEKDHTTIMDLFHNGEVSFGDAHLALEGKPSYAMPFSLSQDKLAGDFFSTDFYLQHLLHDTDRPKDKEDRYIQLKQQRTGYFTADYVFCKEVDKKLTLKSAQDRGNRKSSEGQMFGYESLRAGQTFLFSVIFKTEKYTELVKQALTGKHHVGKSKSAQYGSVDIQPVDLPSVFSSRSVEGKLLLIYAMSNLCLTDVYGKMTFQPDPDRDFNIEGNVIWSCSQIRTYSYSPWNNHRKTSDPQRDCILKGSVIAIELKNPGVDVTGLSSAIGNFQSEGLGRVLYNPDFLSGDPSTGIWTHRFRKYEKPTKEVNEPIEITSPLGTYLQGCKQLMEKERKIGQAVLKYMKATEKDFSKISNSQWGNIRSVSINSETTEKLQKALFGTNRKKLIHQKDKKGLVISGVAAQRYWDKNGGKARETLWEIIEANQASAPAFLAKFATEMAKQKKSD